MNILTLPVFFLVNKKKREEDLGFRRNIFMSILVAPKKIIDEIRVYFEQHRFCSSPN